MNIPKKSYLVCDADDHLRVRYVCSSEREAHAVAADEDVDWKRNVIIEGIVYLNKPRLKGVK